MFFVFQVSMLRYSSILYVSGSHLFVIFCRPKSVLKFTEFIYLKLIYCLFTST